MRTSKQRHVVIDAAGVFKTYNSRSKNPVRALSEVSFKVHEGEIVGLIGPNGAGKSTLLRILLGFLRADSGSSVSVFGEDPESLAVRGKVGYQADSQYRTAALDVRSFLELHAALLSGSRKGQVDELLKFFSLTSAASRSLSALSRGMRQKVELVLSFIGDPQLVFLDEPTASLDPPSVFELRAFLAQQRGQRTVFFSSHNLTEVENVCNRVLFINDGQLMADYDLNGKRSGFLEHAFKKHLIERKKQ